MRRAGIKARHAGAEPAHIRWLEAIDILCLGDRPDHHSLIDLRGQRELNENAVYPVIGVELGDEVEELFSRSLGWQMVQFALQTSLGTCQLLVAHIYMAGRMTPHQHSRQPRGWFADSGAFGDACGNLRTHGFGKSFAIESQSRHSTFSRMVG